MFIYTSRKITAIKLLIAFSLSLSLIFLLFSFNRCHSDNDLSNSLKYNDVNDKLDTWKFATSKNYKFSELNEWHSTELVEMKNESNVDRGKFLGLN